MFGFLKKKLTQAKEGLKKLAEKEEEAQEVRKEALTAKPVVKEKPKLKQIDKAKPAATEKAKPALIKKAEPALKPLSIKPFTGTHETQPLISEKQEEKIEKAKSGGFFKRFTTRTLSEQDIDEFFSDMEIDLLSGNVALEVVDALKGGLKKRLCGHEIKRGQADDFVERAFEQSLLEIVKQGSVDMEETIKKAKEHGRPALFVFIGFNGAGKTTSIAKTARYLTKKGYKVVLAAGDTFRAASIEQLDVHAKKLGVKNIKHKYGADSAAVIFDAMEHGKANGIDVVLADTAGRMHTNANLMQELAKVVRVNKPDLKVLVLDSLAGNDIVFQSREFDNAVNADCMVLTKTDVNEKGGAILSATYCTRKPILFLGTGQEYEDIQLFDPEKFVKALLE